MSAGPTLGEDLSQLVASVGSPLVAAEALSRNVVRLRFANGRVLKGRRLASAAQAREVEEVARALGHAGVPQVLGRAGAALLTPWIEGECLATIECGPDLLRQCGALQGLVHVRAIPAAPTTPVEEALRRIGVRLRAHLDELVASGVLAAADGEQAAEVTRRFSPAGCAIGFLLGDFCAENIVRRDDGELCIVDNETLSIGSSEFDLGRTWYRWPMTRAQRTAYLDGYRLHRDPSSFVTHFPYWAVHATIDGVIFRSRLQLESVAVPVARLGGLLRDLGRGLAPEEVMFRS